MIESLLPWLADLLILLGLAVMTMAVYGMVWLPDVYTRLHAASKAVFLGVLPLLAAAATTGNPTIIYRSILTGIFLLLTTAVAAHAICQAAYEMERSESATQRAGEGANEPAAR